MAAGAVLVVIGMFSIASATLQDSVSTEVVRQAVSLGVGCFVFFFFTYVDLSVFFRNANWLYLLTLLLLVSVLAAGTSVNGAQRWISLGPIGRFQPSEAAKLLLVLWLSKYLAGPNNGRYGGGIIPNFKNFFLMYAALGVPSLLIMMQPDLGTAIVFVSVGTAMLWISGFPWQWFAALIALGGSLLPYALHDYQRERLMIFMDPELDPTGAGWNIIQAKIAIGSGGFWGKGWLLGSQNRLNFVPEHHTDFIFTVIGEEMGFVGGICIIVLLFGIVFKAWQISKKASTSYDSLLAFGIGCLFFVHTFVNIGMTCGILPVVGIPLPFVSYGGTALIVDMAALGILTNIYRRQTTVMSKARELKTV